MTVVPEFIRKNQLLAPYTTYQLGGPADYFVEARREEELIEAYLWAQKEKIPLFILGGGSNVLFDEEGFRGLVLLVKTEKLEVRDHILWAEAGIKVAKLVQAAYEASLTGLEPWTGLPGTLGGAVFGNAGCFGLETKDILIETKVLLPTGEIHNFNSSELEYAYRSSKLKKELGALVLSASLQLQPGNPEEIHLKMREIAKSRATKQPPGLSMGSFFKNAPDGRTAGWLIDQCGLKGITVGKAQISPYHANFFMNLGGATAKDILDLAEFARQKVREKFSIELEAEVRVVPKNGF